MKILDYNHCTLKNCECGWNVKLSGVTDEELIKLKRILVENFDLEDKVEYKGKLSTEIFATDFTRN